MRKTVVCCKKVERGRAQLRWCPSLFMSPRKVWGELLTMVGIVLLIILSWAGCKQPVPKSEKEVMPIRVEVLNGCGEQGLARKVTDWLRRKGFDVVDFGDAENFDFLETIVVDRCGQMNKALQVAKVIGTKNCIQQIKEDPYRIEDVQVIIGQDFHELAFGKNLGR